MKVFEQQDKANSKAVASEERNSGSMHPKDSLQFQVDQSLGMVYPNTSDQSVIQRAIGPAADIGTKVKVKGKGMTYEITKVNEQDGNTTYEVKGPFDITKTVDSTDDEWEIVEEEEVEIDEKLVDFITSCTKSNVSGDISEWSGKMIMVSQSKYESTTDDEPIIWSGGAADCVIVAGFKGQVFLAHVDRLSQDDGSLCMASASEVILCSSIFSDAQNASLNGNVIYLINECKKKGIIPKIYSSGRLAVNSKTKMYLSEFEVPKIEHQEDEYLEAVGGTQNNNNSDSKSDKEA